MTKSDLDKILQGAESGTIQLTATEATEAGKRWNELNAGN